MLQNLLPKTKLDSKLQKTIRGDKKPEVAKSLGKTMEIKTVLKPTVPRQPITGPSDRVYKTPQKQTVKPV